MTTRAPQIGLSKKDVEKVMASWGPEAMARIRANPYTLRQLRIPMKIVEQIAADLGVQKDDSRRLQALSIEALNGLLYGEGHCYQLTHTLCQQVGVTPEVLANCSELHFEGKRVMLRRTYAAEFFIARQVRALGGG